MCCSPTCMPLQLTHRRDSFSTSRRPHPCPPVKANPPPTSCTVVAVASRSRPGLNDERRGSAAGKWRTWVHPSRNTAAATHKPAHRLAPLLGRDDAPSAAAAPADTPLPRTARLGHRWRHQIYSQRRRRASPSTKECPRAGKLFIIYRQ